MNVGDKRRKKGSGSVRVDRERGGFIASADLGRDENNKRIRHTIRADTHDAAAEALARIIAENPAEDPSQEPKADVSTRRVFAKEDRAVRVFGVPWTDAYARLAFPGVYFVRGEGGFFKIGMSDCVARRVIDIATSGPFVSTLVLAAEIPSPRQYGWSFRAGAREAERRLLLSCHEWRHNGEWFLIPEDKAIECRVRIDAILSEMNARVLTAPLVLKRKRSIREIKLIDNGPRHVRLPAELVRARDALLGFG